MERFGFTLVFSLRPERALQGGFRQSPPAWLRELKAEPIFADRTFASGKVDPFANYQFARVGDQQSATLALERVKDQPEVQRAFIAPPRGVLNKSAPTPDWRAQIKLAQATALGQWKGRHRVKVVVIDSGVDRKHPQLSHVGMLDFLRSNVRPDDPLGHGTHVSGLIAAQPVAGQKFEGLAHDCVDLTVYRGMSFPYDPAAYYRALRAASAGKLVNLSVGGEEEDELETELVEELIAQGCIVVAATGNHGDFRENVGYPAACEGVIAVGSVERSGQRADTSAYGKGITVTAPGVEIVSTVPTYALPDIKRFGQPPLGSMSGTSMATPIVTAILAKMLSHKPDLDNRSIVELMEEHLSGPWSEDLGHGILDAEALLANL